MKIVKIWLLIISFATLCFGANAQEMQKIFDSKKPSIIFAFKPVL